MIIEGNYKSFNIEGFKKRITRTMQKMYGSSNPRVDEIIKNTDIYFYTDENSIWGFIQEQFDKNRKSTVLKEIITTSRPSLKYYYHQDIAKDDPILGDSSHINIVYYMVKIGVEEYTKNMEEDQKQQYMAIYDSMIKSLGLEGQEPKVQLMFLEQLKDNTKKLVRKHVSRMGEVGGDYIRLKNAYQKKRKELIEYLGYTYGLSERDEYILKCANGEIDNSILSLLDLNGLFFGVEITSPGDMAAFSPDADIRLMEGDLTESIYEKRVRIVEYINKLPPYEIKEDETWESVYFNYLNEGYRMVTPDEYKLFEDYRLMLSGQVISTTQQIEEFLEQVENPVKGGYVVPYGAIDRQSFMNEDSMFIPNAKYGKNGEVVSKGVVCLNDNIHVSDELALKTMMHEIGHGFISRIVEDETEGFILDTAMFGKFRYYGDKEALSDDLSRPVSGYCEPTRLIENINERKSKEMFQMYTETLGLDNPFGNPTDFVFQYYNSYSLEDFITEKFYNRFKNIINDDIARGTYTLRDTIGVKNIINLENLLKEFSESRLKREFVSKLISGQTASIDIEQLSEDGKEDYAYFMERVDTIMTSIDKYINRPVNMNTHTDGM